MKPIDPIVPIANNQVHLASHLFNPTRLTIARHYRGWSKKELAERIDKTIGAISQFESGKSRPDASSVRKLGMALGFPVGFFARPDHVPMLRPEECSFRSQRSARKSEKEQVLATADLLLDLFKFLEEFVQLPAVNVPKIYEGWSSLGDIEEVAEEVRTQWGLGLGPIPDSIKLLEGKGIVVAFIESTHKKLDAFSAWHTEHPFVFLTTEKGSTSRMRMSAAHELGHLVLHEIARPGNHEQEAEASRFASAFLLPKKPFLMECPNWLNWDQFYEMKLRWRISIAALIKRAYDLECITEASYRRAYMQLNHRGERIKERFEPPAEEPTLLQQCLKIASEGITSQGLIEKLCLGESVFDSVVKSTIWPALS